MSNGQIRQGRHGVLSECRFPIRLDTRLGVQRRRGRTAAFA